jgi:hypothetical protein
VQENNRDQHLKSTQLSLNMCGRTWNHIFTHAANITTALRRPAML